MSKLFSALDGKKHSPRFALLKIPSRVGRNCFKTFSERPSVDFALNSVFASVCPASDRATFENNCVKTSKDRHILLQRQSSAWSLVSDNYKACVDIRAGWRQRTVASRVNVRLEHLFVAFENNCVKGDTDRSTL